MFRIENKHIVKLNTMIREIEINRNSYLLDHLISHLIPIHIILFVLISSVVHYKHSNRLKLLANFICAGMAIFSFYKYQRDIIKDLNAGRCPQQQTRMCLDNNAEFKLNLKMYGIAYSPHTTEMLSRLKSKISEYEYQKERKLTFLKGSHNKHEQCRRKPWLYRFFQCDQDRAATSMILAYIDADYEKGHEVYEGKNQKSLVHNRSF